MAEAKNGQFAGDLSRCWVPCMTSQGIHDVEVLNQRQDVQHITQGAHRIQALHLPHAKSARAVTRILRNKRATHQRATTVHVSPKLGKGAMRSVRTRNSICGLNEAFQVRMFAIDGGGDGLLFRSNSASMKEGCC